MENDRQASCTRRRPCRDAMGLAPRKSPPSGGRARRRRAPAGGGARSRPRGGATVCTRQRTGRGPERPAHAPRCGGGSEDVVRQGATCSRRVPSSWRRRPFSFSFPRSIELWLLLNAIGASGLQPAGLLVHEYKRSYRRPKAQNPSRFCSRLLLDQRSRSSGFTGRSISRSWRPQLRRRG